MGPSYSNMILMQDGLELIPSNPTMVMLLDPGMYLMAFQYDVNDLKAGADFLNVTLLGEPERIDGPTVTSITPEPDAPMFLLTEVNQNGDVILGPYFFDKTTLVLPATYWAKSSGQTVDEEELNKHSFIISYDEIEEGDETLNLYVTHVLRTDKDADRTFPALTTVAYNLSAAISEFTGKGNTLKKIVFNAKVNDQANDLEDAKDATYEIDYTKITEYYKFGL